MRVLMYHAVGSPVREDYLGLFSLPKEHFREHLPVMQGMRVVSFTTPPEAGEATVSITFDDGYADNLYVAAPMLSENNLPFTVFVTTDFVRQGMPGFMTPVELKHLAQMPGVEIGAHGCSHRPLTACDDKELAIELGDSRKYLEDLLGRPIVAMAYPHGAADRRVRDAAQHAGFTHAGCSHFDVNRPGRDSLMLSRCNILCYDTARVLRQKLHGDWDWYRWRSTDPFQKK
jgi:peptidoglycan/xylan/chitin deacetylase (PgdA/CDA1 family)